MKKPDPRSMNFPGGILLNLSLFVFLFLQNGTGAIAQTHYLVDDRFDIYPFLNDTIDLLGNDVFLPEDSIIRISAPGCHLHSHHDSLGNYTFTTWFDEWGKNFTDTCWYRVYMNTDTLTAHAIYTVHDNGFDYLDINNVKARFDCKSMHFFYDSPEFFVPKNSGKSSIYSNSLWIGGKDENGDLHLAAQRYGMGPDVSGNGFHNWDFYPGPILNNTYDSVYENKWNYIWNIRKSELEYHIQHWVDQGYTPPNDFLTWPGNGDITLGHPWRLAPFNDLNGDGLYMPQLGDYPEVRGDQV